MIVNDWQFSSVGNGVGWSVGWSVGISDGGLLGRPVGAIVGVDDGASDGSLLGAPVGDSDGSPVGSRDGNPVGALVGVPVGDQYRGLLGAPRPRFLARERIATHDALDRGADRGSGRQDLAREALALKDSRGGENNRACDHTHQAQ